MDDAGHVLMIAKEKSGLRLNGDVQAEFRVKKGLRYRFRVVYSGGSGEQCPVRVGVDGHDFRVIALDGRPVNTYEAGSVTISSGERVDFVLRASEKIGSYQIRITSDCDDAEVFGVMKYEDREGLLTKISKEKISKKKSERMFTTKPCEVGLGRVCLGDVRGLRNVPLELREEVGKKIYLPFDYVDLNQSYGGKL